MIYFDKAVTDLDYGQMAPWVDCHAVRHAQLIRGGHELIQLNALTEGSLELDIHPGFVSGA